MAQENKQKQLLKNKSDKKEEIKAPAASRTVKKWFYIIMVLLPILFFILLEIALRVFNYGYDFTQWVNPAPGKYVLNPDIAHKYFHNIQNVPYSNQDIFDEIKRPDAFRVFVLGESSGAGYPFTPNGAFSRYLQQRLRLKYPESTIEVINCSMTAINTYTMRDLFPGILDQKPDLVLIYAGHNEYYGALGVGSNESFGTGRAIVNLAVYLERFKVFQLVRNLLKSTAGLFSGQAKPATGTLMSRMAQDQYISLNSNNYQKGIEQFEGNMRDIIQMAKDKNVPVILSTVASNLKDQFPFVSISGKGLPSANEIFFQARKSLENKDLRSADSLFRYAKDLDALRFRAPTGINNLIVNFGKEFNYPVINVDSLFNASSSDNITGDNLMTDHLHPTLKGYFMIGDLFYREMEKLKILPKTKQLVLDDKQQDSLVMAKFPFARIDSIIGDYRIKLLKNDWPYIDKSKKIPDDQLLNPKDHIDSLVYDLVYDKANWEYTHRKAAEWYLVKGDFKEFLSVMDVLIDQYPIVTEYHDYTINKLLQIQEYDMAYSYLLHRSKYKEDAFSNKWLGIIDLYKNRVPSSKKYLTESLKYDPNDSQVWYNLAGDYVNEENYSKALEMVSKAVTLRPGYQDAVMLKNELLNVLKK